MKDNPPGKVPIYSESDNIRFLPERVGEIIDKWNGATTSYINEGEIRYLSPNVGPILRLHIGEHSFPWQGTELELQAVVNALNGQIWTFEKDEEMSTGESIQLNQVKTEVFYEKSFHIYANTGREDETVTV